MKDLEKQLDLLKEKLIKNTKIKFEKTHKQVVYQETIEEQRGKIRAIAKNDFDIEWTPDKRERYKNKCISDFTDEVKKRLNKAADSEYISDMKQKLRSMKVFPLRKLIYWIAGISITYMAASGTYQYFTMRSFYNKMVKQRPEIVQMNDSDLAKLLMKDTTQTIAPVIIKQKPDFPIPRPFRETSD